MNCRWIVPGLMAVILLSSACAADEDLVNQIDDQTTRLGSLESQLAALEGSSERYPLR